MNVAASPVEQNSPLEIEAKFVLPDDSLFVRLRESPELTPGYKLGDPFEQVVIDRYLDAPDLRLLRQGYGLRVRSVQSQQVVTLKSRRISDPSAVFRRTEIEAPLGPMAQVKQVTGWPEEVAAAVTPLLGKARLATLCVLKQHRIKRAVYARQSRTGRPLKRPRVVAELSLDTVHIHAKLTGPALAHTYELEIELASGASEEELLVLVDAVKSQMKTEASPQSKLEHALKVIGRHPSETPENWQGIYPKMHMAEACRLIWHEQLTEMLHLEAGVRFSDDPEYVHAMRVATRRARAAARLYDEFFEQKTIRSYLRDLRMTARLLGAVRDLDVAIEKLDRFARERQVDDQPGVQNLLAAWRSRRDKAHRKMLAWFDDKQYGKFLRDFRAFCQTADAGARNFEPAPGDPVIPYQVRHVAPSMILTRFEGVRAYETLFETDGEVVIESLHQLRIECKYLRYNLEFVADLLGSDADKLTKELRKLQDRLGNLNDAAVSKQMVSEAQPDAMDPGIAAYRQAQDAVIEKFRGRIADDLAHFVDEHNRRRLVQALARI